MSTLVGDLLALNNNKGRNHLAVSGITACYLGEVELVCGPQWSAMVRLGITEFL